MSLFKNYDELLSGRDRSWRARCIRATLSAVEPIYASAVSVRNWTFHSGWRKCHGVSAPVISIGNITVGGTGKTPVVRWTVEQLLRLGVKPAIVSRGFGAAPNRHNDEYHELKLYLPDVPHVQDRDRVAAAKTALLDHAAEMIVLDDGMQHRRIARDFEIVLIDATRPFGYGHLLPRGLLRESISSLARANFVWLTRVDLVSQESVEELTNKIAQYVPRSRIGRVAFRPGRLLELQGREHLQDAWLDRTVMGFCGIGNPTAFEAMLAERTKLKMVRRFADHYQYTDEDLRNLVQEAKRQQADGLLCTVKDLVKIRELNVPDFPVCALSVEAEMIAGRQAFVDELRALISRKIVSDRDGS